LTGFSFSFISPALTFPSWWSIHRPNYLVGTDF